VGKPTAAPESQDLGELVNAIVQEGGRLLSQQIDLLRREVGQELQRAGTAALRVASGGGLAAAGGILSGLALAHLMRRVTGLPLWCCYGAAAGACGGAGAALLRTGARTLGDLQLLPPPQSAAALGENLSWLKEQVSPAAPERPT